MIFSFKHNLSLCFFLTGHHGILCYNVTFDVLGWLGTFDLEYLCVSELLVGHLL
jgi:hypothetical protein